MYILFNEIKVTMHWKKRTGAKRFVQYLHLPDTAPPITKIKKKKSREEKGYDPYVAKRTKYDSIALQHQKANLEQKFFKYNYEDNRNFTHTAKPPLPVYTSYDHLMKDYDKNNQNDLRLRDVQHRRNVAFAAAGSKLTNRFRVHLAKLRAAELR